MSDRRPDEAILAVEVALGAVGEEAGAEVGVVGLGDRAVDGAPPDLVVAGRLVDDELVLRRATGVLAGQDDERAVGGEEALAVADGVLVQLGGREVGAYGPSQDGALDRRGGGHRRATPRRQGRSRSDRPAARDASREGPQESASAVALRGC